MNKTNININTYGNYSSDNYGAHCLKVNIGQLVLWFSYKTVIAFADRSMITISENIWGPTTGKHLNWIDDGNKKGRLPRDKFETELNKCLKKYKLVV